MDAFFASVEVLRKPELKGKPVIVGGNPYQRGVVSTCSYEARRYGIHSAMPLRTAYKLCPEAVFLSVDIPFYRRFSERIFSILKEYTSLVEPLGLDEAFLDVSPLQVNSKRESVEIAKEIKERIKREIGLTASVGIGPNKLLAKIASDLNKPDGLTIVDGVEEFLSELPVSLISGVGPKTETKLVQLGVEKVKDLRAMPLDILVSHFGKVFGRTLYEYSRGIDNSPVVNHREPKSKSRERTFQWDVRDVSLIRKTIINLTKELFLSLEVYRPRTVGLKVRYQDFSTYTRSHTSKRPIKELKYVLPIVISLLEKFEFSKKVRLVGVRFSNLKSNAGG